MLAIGAHYNGRFIVLDEPLELQPNAKVTVLVGDADQASLTNDCARLSEACFDKIWDNPLDAEYDRL